MTGCFALTGLGKDPVKKDPLRPRGPLSLPQQFCCTVWKQYSPFPFSGLGLSGAETTVRVLMEGTADLQCPGLRVKVPPLKPTDLTPVDGKFRVEEVVPDWIRLDRRHEGVHFLVGQDALGLAVPFGCRHAVSRISGDEVGRDGVLQRPMEHGVDTADCTAG